MLSRPAPESERATIEAVGGDAAGHACWLLPLIGERWCVPVLMQLAGGAMRYNELARAIPGISMRMLSLTLKQLARAGLVQRTAHAVQPPRTEYALSELGRSLMVPLRGLTQWAQRHRDEVESSRSPHAQPHADAAAQVAMRRIVRFTPLGVRYEALPE